MYVKISHSDALVNFIPVIVNVFALTDTKLLLILRQPLLMFRSAEKRQRECSVNISILSAASRD